MGNNHRSNGSRIWRAKALIAIWEKFTIIIGMREKHLYFWEKSRKWVLVKYGFTSRNDIIYRNKVLVAIERIDA